MLAMFASTQLAAATLTVRQQESAGRPVAGSMMWCRLAPPRRHARAEVLEVARPPSRITTTWLGSTSAMTVSKATSSAIPTSQPFAGGSPATLMSPPRLTSTPQPNSAATRAADRSAASALAVAPRSSMTPAGTVTWRRAASSRTCRQPPAGASGRRKGRVRPRARAQSWSYPSPTRDSPQVGSTSPSVSSAPASATFSASANRALTGTGRPRAWLTRESSESDRKREQAASIAASSAARTRPAESRASGSVTSSVAEVPSARKVRAAIVAVAVGISPLRAIRWSGSAAEADWPACTVGWGFADAPGCACRWCRRAAGVAAADVDGCMLGVVPVWLVVWAGAVRANKVTRPTAVTVLSCVARQVSLDRRRRPTGAGLARVVLGNDHRGGGHGRGISIRVSAALGRVIGPGSGICRGLISMTHEPGSKQDSG